VIVWEETFAPPSPTSPKVRALQDRLANDSLEKDSPDLKIKVEQRLAKASALKEKAQEEAVERLRQESEQKAQAVAARQMEAMQAKEEIARRDRARQEDAEREKARQAAERAERTAQRELEMENVRLARLQSEDELKQRHSDKLQAMEERLAAFNVHREQQCKDMSESHLARVARREALLERMHDKGIIETEQLRRVQEQKQIDAEARRSELLDAKAEAAAKDANHAAEVAARIKQQEEDETAKKKQQLEEQMQAAADRRVEQLSLPKSRQSPVKAKPSASAPMAEPSGSWFGVRAAVAVAAVSAAAFFINSRMQH